MFRLFGLPPGEYIVTASPRIVGGEMRAMTDDGNPRDHAGAAAATGRAGGAGRRWSAAIRASPATPTPTPTAGAGRREGHRRVRAGLLPGHDGRGVGASMVTVGAGEERTASISRCAWSARRTVEGMVVGAAGHPAAERAVDDDADVARRRSGARGHGRHRDARDAARGAGPGRQVHVHGGRAGPVHDFRARDESAGGAGAATASAASAARRRRRRRS